jgi:hypothetical protein
VAVAPEPAAPGLERVCCPRIRSVHRQRTRRRWYIVGGRWVEGAAVTAACVVGDFEVFGAGSTAACCCRPPVDWRPSRSRQQPCSRPPNQCITLLPALPVHRIKHSTHNRGPHTLRRDEHRQGLMACTHGLHLLQPPPPPPHTHTDRRPWAACPGTHHHHHHHHLHKHPRHPRQCVKTGLQGRAQARLTACR